MITKELLDYFNGDELAATVWYKKYRLYDEQTPDDSKKRIIDELVKTELKRIQVYNEEQFKDLSEYGKNRYSFDKSINEKLETIYNRVIGFDRIIPGGSMLQGIGNLEFYSSLSNCFVLGRPVDSYAGINQKDSEQTQVMKRRGGCGIDLSSIRPDGAKVNNQSQFSSGPVLFANRFSNTCLEVAQYGRRGALMLSIHVNHPNALNFAKEKQDLSKLTGCNSSIIYSEEFMLAVKNDSDYIQRFPIDLDLFNISYDDLEYDKLEEIKYIDVENEKLKTGYIKKIKAKEFWDKACKYATATAEPGVLFEANWKNGGTDYVYTDFRPVSTNPCSEIAMQPYDSCRLMSNNLFGCVVSPFTKHAYFDFDLAYELFYEQLTILDVAIDLEIEYIDRIINKISNSDEPQELKDSEINLWVKIQEQAIKGRRAGAGFTGLGDTLAALNLSYNNNKSSIDLIENIFQTKLKAEMDAGIDMAILYGSFEGFNFDLEYPDLIPSNKIFETILDVCGEDKLLLMEKYGRRNVSWSTAAPTGSLSLLAQTTSGIEPLFSPFHMRRKKCIDKDERVDYIDPADGQKFTVFPVFHYQFKQWLKLQDVNPDNLTENEINEWFEKSPWSGSKAEQIHWEDRIIIQACVQKYTTHSISSTINLPSDTTADVVNNIYLKSYEYGLKGNTVYRDGSRGGVLVNTKSEPVQNKHEFEPCKSPKRPRILPAVLHTIKTKKKLYSVFIGFYCNKPYEIFIASGADDLPININPQEDYIAGEIIKEAKNWYNFECGDLLIKEISDIEDDEEKALSLMLSMCLRHRTPLKYVIKVLEKTKPLVGTFTSHLIKILTKYMPDNEETGVPCPNPECNGKLHFDNGCVLCPDCGWSKC